MVFKSSLAPIWQIYSGGVCSGWAAAKGVAVSGGHVCVSGVCVGVCVGGVWVCLSSQWFILLLSIPRQLIRNQEAKVNVSPWLPPVPLPQTD